MTSIPAIPAIPLAPLQLQARERAWEYLPPGAEIRVERGRICLHQRLYLAHDWAHMPVYLYAGERYRVSDGGWMEIEALDGARLAVIPQHSLLRPLLQAVYGLRRWLGRLQTI